MVKVLEGETLSIHVPIQHLENGVIRVGGTRIPLERILYAYNSGQTPEQIIHSFDTLKLADVYGVISFYLNNRAIVEEYLRWSEEEDEKAEREILARMETNGSLERLRTMMDRKRA